MDGTYITGMRTGVVGALAVKYLARKEAQTMGVVGAGEQAFYQIAAIVKVKKITKIIIFDIKAAAIEKLKKALKKEGIEISQGTIEEVSAQDILVTTTPSKTPIVQAQWIRTGTHINAIGADAPGKQELDPKILHQAKIVVDDWAQASHSGEINVALAQGIIGKKDIYSSLGEIIAHKKPGRHSNNEITIFDSTGLAIQDLYTANFFYRLFQQRGKVKDFKVFN
jgi:alanine dehydrogenase